MEIQCEGHTVTGAERCARSETRDNNHTTDQPCQFLAYIDIIV